MKSSVRQGCPCSALLFAIYLEPFCLKVLNNTKITGYQFLSHEIKVLAYADDIAIFCQNEKSVEEAIRDARTFCSLTGSAISWHKCQGFWHGEWNEKPEIIQGITFTSMPSKYLGVPLQYYQETTEQWAAETEHVKTKTTKWGRRDFSIFARAAVCNVFLVAKVFYMLQVLCMSRACVQRLHRIFAVFIWGSTWERTGRVNIFHKVKKGGLGLSHLFLKQIVLRFFYLRDQSDGFLRAVMQVRLRDKLPEYVVSSYGSQCGVVKGFLREVVYAFQFLQVHFSFDYLASATKKQLYKDLVDIMCPGLYLYTVKCM